MKLKTVLFIHITIVLCLFNTTSLAAIYHQGDIDALKTIMKTNGEPIYIGNSDSDYAQWGGITWSSSTEDKRVKYLSITDPVMDLDVTGLGELKGLYCIDNELSTLDVSGLSSLNILHCYNNSLTELDVSQNTALTGLLCHSNQLADLDVSNNNLLNVLSFSNNFLTNIDLSGNTALVYLFAYNNYLTALNVSQNTALKYINCSINRIRELDLSNLTALTQLSIKSNHLPFSSIRTAIHNGSFPTSLFEYSPQRKVFEDTTILEGGIIDYSNEFMVKNDSTEFRWYNTNGTPFNGYDDYYDMPEVIDDGVFRFNNPGEYYCKMRNAALPGFYSYPLTSGNVKVVSSDSIVFKLSNNSQKTIDGNPLILYLDQTTNQYKITGWSEQDLPLQLQVVDVNGKQHLSDIIYSPYDCYIKSSENLKSGVYIINLFGGSKRYTAKFLR